MHIILLAFTLFFTSLSIAHADCSTPTAVEGGLEYFTASSEFKFCDGTDWISISEGSGSNGPDFESAETTITTGDQTYTLAHGLNATPTQFDAYLICKTTDLGYAVGDVVKTTNQYTKISSASAWGGHNVTANATNIIVQQETDIYIANRSTGFPTVPTYANWKLIVRGWQ